MTGTDWERMNRFWDALTRENILGCFGDPKTSFYWVCVENRRFCFDKQVELCGLRRID